MKKIIILLAIVALHSCDIPAKYPITHHTRSGCITYINDRKIVISSFVIDRIIVIFAALST